MSLDYDKELQKCYNNNPSQQTIRSMSQTTQFTLVNADQWKALLKYMEFQNRYMNSMAEVLKTKVSEETAQRLGGAIICSCEDLWNKEKATLEDILSSAASDAALKISAPVLDLKKQAGVQKEEFSSELRKMSDTTSYLGKKLIPLLIGIPTAVQLLFLTAYILLEIFFK